MKKYISGFVAIVIAVVALSFTTRTAAPTVTNVAGDKTMVDPCTEQQKRWFKINIPCSQQPNLNVSILRNHLNYVLFGTGTIAPDKLEDCPDNDCVCAVFACPQTVDGVLRPIITSTTQIYTDLGTYSTSGGVSVPATIVEKGVAQP